MFLFEGTLSEYKQKVLHLKELRKDMSASDSEQELDTSDVLVLAKITHELEDVVRFLQSMEDLQMRYALDPFPLRHQGWLYESQPHNLRKKNPAKICEIVILPVHIYCLSLIDTC